MATLKQRLHRKNGTSYDTIHLETNATVVKMSTTDNTTVNNKLTTVDNSINNLGTEMSSLKSSVSSGKAQIASAITDKGVSTSASDSFSQMATNISQIKGGISGVPVYGTDFTYSGDYQVISDGNDNWRIKFLTSGTFIPKSDMQIDVFLVGGGGGGGYTAISNTASGGGGGYTNTVKSLVLSNNIDYPLVIGNGGTGESDGGNTSSFSVTANGGKRGSNTQTAGVRGGDGGSGGGAAYASTSSAPGNGGSDGSDGGSSNTTLGGTGQGTTTREFGESSGDLYAGGGGGIYGKNIGIGGNGGGGDGKKSGEANTGGGGGNSDRYGSSGDTSGGSGIVIIRNHRE